MKLLSHPASILLMSVLVIGVFTLFLALTMAEVNLATSYQVLNTTENQHSYYAAEACLEDTLLHYERDTSFTGATFSVDADTSCTSSVSGSQVNILVSNGVYAENFTATFSLSSSGTVNNVHLSSWKEN